MAVLKNHGKHRFSRREHAFSLVELMVVVAILGILAAVVVVAVGGQTYEAMVSRVKMDFSSIDTAIQLYKNKMFTYPEELQYLITAPPDDDGGRWKNPFLRGGIPRDPWNNEYIYTRESATGTGYDLVTYGADGKAGGSEEAKDLTIQELLWSQGDGGSLP